MEPSTHTECTRSRRVLAGSLGLVVVIAATGVVASEAGSQPAPVQPAPVACARNDGERLLRLVHPKQTCGSHESRVALSGEEAAGSGGVAGLEGVRKEGVGSSRYRSVTATCPPGKKVFGGGFEFVNQAGGDLPVALEYNRPTAAMDGWEVSAHLNGSFFGQWGIRVHAVCAKVSGG